MVGLYGCGCDFDFPQDARPLFDIFDACCIISNVSCVRSLPYIEVGRKRPNRGEAYSWSKGWIDGALRSLKIKVILILVNSTKKLLSAQISSPKPALS